MFGIRIGSVFPSMLGLIKITICNILHTQGAYRVVHEIFSIACITYADIVITYYGVLSVFLVFKLFIAIFLKISGNFLYCRNLTLDFITAKFKKVLFE